MEEHISARVTHVGRMVRGEDEYSVSHEAIRELCSRKSGPIRLVPDHSQGPERIVFGIDGGQSSPAIRPLRRIKLLDQVAGFWQSWTIAWQKTAPERHGQAAPARALIQRASRGAGSEER